METNKQYNTLEIHNATIVVRVWVQIIKPENVIIIFIIIEVSCIDKVQTCTLHETYRSKEQI